MSEFEGEFLRWTDLTDLDVYHVAHLEHEAREAMLSTVGQLATQQWDDYEEVSGQAEQALTQYHNQLRRNDEWLEDQALLRDYDGAILVSEPEDEPVDHEDFRSWFDTNFAVYSEDMSIDEFARYAGVSASVISRLRNGRSGSPYSSTITKLVTAFADLHKLSGEERTLFIEGNEAELRRILPKRARAPRSKR